MRIRSVARNDLLSDEEIRNAEAVFPNSSSVMAHPTGSMIEPSNGDPKLVPLTQDNSDKSL